MTCRVGSWKNPLFKQPKWGQHKSTLAVLVLPPLLLPQPLYMIGVRLRDGSLPEKTTCRLLVSTPGQSLRVGGFGNLASTVSILDKAGGPSPSARHCSVAGAVRARCCGVCCGFRGTWRTVLGRKGGRKGDGGGGRFEEVVGMFTVSLVLKRIQRWSSPGEDGDVEGMTGALGLVQWHQPPRYLV